MQRIQASLAQFTRDRLRRSRAFIVSAVLTLICLSLNGSQLQASCGDYLFHGSAQSLMEDHTMGSGSADASKQKLPCPCHGPSCQRAPANDPIPPASTVVALEDECLWIGLSSNPELTNVSALDRIAELFISPMITYRLDRPPNL